MLTTKKEICFDVFILIIGLFLIAAMITLVVFLSKIASIGLTIPISILFCLSAISVSYVMHNFFSDKYYCRK